MLWGLPPTRLFALRRVLLRFAGLKIASGVCVCGRGWVYGRGRLSIGPDSWLSPGVVIHTHLDAPIEIGAHCDIGPGVEIITGSHEIGGPNRRAGQGTAAPVTIDAGCWIGARTLILGGVRIGAGSVVAAGAVVTREVMANSLVGGIPSSLKRQLS